MTESVEDGPETLMSSIEIEERKKDRKRLMLKKTSPVKVYPVKSKPSTNLNLKDYSQELSKSSIESEDDSRITRNPK